MPLRDARKIRNFFLVSLAVLVVFMFAARPVSRTEERRIFVIQTGERFTDIANRLEQVRLVRSAALFKTLALLTLRAGNLQAGTYELSSNFSTVRILDYLSSGSGRSVTVRVLEGISVYEVDMLLAERGVITRGDLVRIVLERSLEGQLFPDTYEFFLNSDVEEVLDKFLANFDGKVAPLLAKEENSAKIITVLASLLEREVPDYEERRIVAGILKKRYTASMPLQVDATVCYVKRLKNLIEWTDSCYPLDPLDFKLNSPYNTYVHSGYPPGPIGNPGLSAFLASLDPEPSPYWFYLSDPVTKRTIFSKTLEEQQTNKLRYLR